MPAGQSGLTATLTVWGAPLAPNSSLLILVLISPDSLHTVLDTLLLPHAQPSFFFQPLTGPPVKIH